MSEDTRKQSGRRENLQEVGRSSKGKDGKGHW